MEILLWNHSNVIFLPTHLSFNNIAKIHYIICVDQCMATSQINQIEHESDLIKTYMREREREMGLELLKGHGMSWHA